MARLRSYTSLILVITLWYTLTGVLGVFLHHHLGWHALVGPADSGTCNGHFFCKVRSPENCPLQFDTSPVFPVKRSDLTAKQRIAASPRPAAGVSRGHCPICQFQFQPKTAQLVFWFTNSARCPRVIGLDPVQRVIFTLDFSWQSRAPPSV